MARTAWKGRGCLLGLLGLAAAVTLFPFQGIIWDGGFTSAEYRLTFADEAGRPVPGVTLRVLTRAGGECHLYPINEFLPDQGPTSDTNGRMVFHHVAEGIEFGGREYWNLLGMSFGETDAPRYVLVFSVAGQEVHRVRYDDLRPWRDRDRLPIVTREWQHPDWPSRESAAHQGDWRALRYRLFDGNSDGALDREERTAAGYFERVLERFADGRGKHNSVFYVVERAVTISTP